MESIFRPRSSCQKNGKLRRKKTKKKNVSKERLIRFLLNFVKIIGHIDFTENFPSLKFTKSKYLTIWSVAVGICSSIILLTEFVAYCYTADNIVVLYICFRVPVFALLQFFSWIAFKKSHLFFSSLSEIQMNLSSSNFNWSQSVINEILLLFGSVSTLMSGILGYYLTSFKAYKWPRMILAAFSVSCFTTYLLAAFHPALCYCIMYFLGDVQHFVLQSQLEFCQHFNFIEIDEEYRCLGKYSTIKTQSIKKPKEMVNKVHGDCSPFPSFLYRYDSEFIACKHKRQFSASTMIKFQAMLTYSEKLLSEVEAVARLYMEIFMYVLATLTSTSYLLETITIDIFVSLHYTYIYIYNIYIYIIYIYIIYIHDSYVCKIYYMFGVCSAYIIIILTTKRLFNLIIFEQ